MSSLPLVIVNPASAGGSTGAAWPGIASEIRSHFGAFNCAFTLKSGDATAIAMREAHAGRRFIIACGGDGTISEVANGIIESGAPAELGILPSGTGGDFRRTLNIPARASDAAAALRTGRTRLMDAGRVNYVNEAGNEESRYFLNVASFGMGGAVVRRVKDNAATAAGGARLLGGRAAFALAALQTVLTFSKPSVRVRIDDGREARLSVTNFCVANARYFGGGMKVAPGARVDDGLFDVVHIGDLNSASVIANSYRVYLGTHLGMRDVRHTLARRVAAQPAETSADVRLEVDGELVGRLPATFEILPRALNIRCP